MTCFPTVFALTFPIFHAMIINVIVALFCQNAVFFHFFNRFRPISFVGLTIFFVAISQKIRESFPSDSRAADAIRKFPLGPRSPCPPTGQGSSAGLFLGCPAFSSRNSPKTSFFGRILLRVPSTQGNSDQRTGFPTVQGRRVSTVATCGV